MPNLEYLKYDNRASGESSMFFLLIRLTMKADTKNNKPYTLRTLTGFKSLAIGFSPEAIAWLSGTTKSKDENGNILYEVSNFSLYSDLMSRMALADSTADYFRRPQAITVGQAQISELKLVEQWGLGRKKVRNILDKMQQLGLIEVVKSRVATLVSFSGIDYIDMLDDEDVV